MIIKNPQHAIGIALAIEYLNINGILTHKNIDAISDKPNCAKELTWCLKILQESNILNNNINTLLEKIPRYDKLASAIKYLQKNEKLNQDSFNNIIYSFNTVTCDNSTNKQPTNYILKGINYNHENQLFKSDPAPF